MRKFLLFALIMSFCYFCIAQNRALPLNSSKPKLVSFEDKKAVKFTENEKWEFIPGDKSKTIFDEVQIGQTIYDLQSNSSIQNRLYQFADGTFGATWTMGFDPSGSWSSRGTGYNYFDGNAWGPEPLVRIEDEWTGWPSYVPYGENGELVVSHTWDAGLWVGHRDEKGTGDWQYSILPGPVGAVDISWPRAISSGLDNNIIHALYVTYVQYNNQANALGYSRSEDGGITWNPQNLFFDEFGPDYYRTLAGDVYEWAEPKDGKIAFLAGESYTDLVLMVSEDDGETWDQTIVWECPYPQNTGMPTDTFYAPDGAHHLAFDNEGKINIVFSVYRVQTEDWTQFFYWPGLEGIVYWNEDMETFSSDPNALNPYNHPNSELIEDYNLIGWTQDVNSNGIIDVEEIGTYYLAFSSMPQIIIDEQDRIFLVYSGVTEGFENDGVTYRHIWIRSSIDGGLTWGPFYDMNTDLIYVFNECVFPSVSHYSDENIYLIYQADDIPSMHVRGDEHPMTDNYIRFMSIAKDEVIDGISENNKKRNNISVSQNFPNPANEYTKIYLSLESSNSLTFEVTNLLGQIVYKIDNKEYLKGLNEIVINTSKFEPGLYNYSVGDGKNLISKKMIVK